MNNSRKTFYIFLIIFVLFFHNFFLPYIDYNISYPNLTIAVVTANPDPVSEDKIPPTIEFSGEHPHVQLKNGPVEIRCIAIDFSGILSVTVTMHSPDTLTETHPMNSTLHDAKYMYTKSYESVGEYTYFITVTDTKGIRNTTEEKTFWITDDLNDTDNDGMPDAWEERYGFNPYNPSDAVMDVDNDSITNLKEYQQGTDPVEKLSFPSESVNRLQENWLYLTGSVLVLAIIVLLAWHEIRRRKP